MKLLFEGWRKYLNEAIPPEALERLKQIRKFHDDLAKEPLRFEVNDTISNKIDWEGTTNGTPVIIPARTKLLVKEISSTTNISVCLKEQQELKIPDSYAQLIKIYFVNVDEKAL